MFNTRPARADTEPIQILSNVLLSSRKNELSSNLSYTSPEAHASASRMLLNLANAFLRLCQDH